MPLRDINNQYFKTILKVNITVVAPFHFGKITVIKLQNDTKIIKLLNVNGALVLFNKILNLKI